MGGWLCWACLKPGGSLLQPPPALPEPGPCAACPPSPFVPEESGGGRPTSPWPGTSLNPHSASTPPFSEAAQPACSSSHSSKPDRARPTSLGNVGATWGCRTLPPPTQNPGPHPLAQLPVENLWSLLKKPCPLCCLLPVSPYNLPAPFNVIIF